MKKIWQRIEEKHAISDTSEMRNLKIINMLIIAWKQIDEQSWLIPRQLLPLTFDSLYYFYLSICGG